MHFASHVIRSSAMIIFAIWPYPCDSRVGISRMSLIARPLLCGQAVARASETPFRGGKRARFAIECTSAYILSLSWLLGCALRPRGIPRGTPRRR